MTLLNRVHRILLTFGLASLILVVTVFNIAPGASWAATSLSQNTDQLHSRIAMMNDAKTMQKNVEGQAQEAIGKLTGDSKKQVTGKAKQLEAKTQRGIGNSIENPNYQPGGKTKQAERQANEATKGIKAEAIKAFN